MALTCDQSAVQVTFTVPVGSSSTLTPVQAYAKRATTASMYTFLFICCFCLLFGLFFGLFFGLGLGGFFCFLGRFFSRLSGSAISLLLSLSFFFGLLLFFLSFFFSSSLNS